MLGYDREVKGEDKKDDLYMCLMDLYRISPLSPESINHNNYKGIIGIQVIGMQVTFYISTLLSKQFYVMIEICSDSHNRKYGISQRSNCC
jgi:hypothetical protein